MYSRFSIQTRLSTADAEATLARLVGARRDGSGKPFVGRVDGGRFTFCRLFIGRNSFLPIITGRIVQGEGGAIVRGTMRLHWAIALVEPFWVLLPIVAVVAFLRGDTMDTLAVMFALLVFGTVNLFFVIDGSSHSVSDTLRPFLLTMVPVWIVAPWAARIVLRER